MIYKNNLSSSLYIGGFYIMFEPGVRIASTNVARVVNGQMVMTHREDMGYTGSLALLETKLGRCLR
jgi:hypothetical protein